MSDGCVYEVAHKEKKAVIFGAGEWGRVAYHYYKESIEIVCYIDNDERIWNTELNGIPICPPEILKSERYVVIVANKRFEDEIKKQLLCDYGIRGAIIFRITEKMQELYLEENEDPEVQELIVAFSHGLGNQMFQYALYKCLLMEDRNVRADLSAYIKPDMMPFELPQVFPNVKLGLCNPAKKEQYLKGGKTYIEEPPRNQDKTTFKKELFHMEWGYIEGFHCSYQYPELIRQQLLRDFEFSYQKDETLCRLREFFFKENVVGVHVRRGDFLNPKYQREVGSLCNSDFYFRAIDLMKSINEDLIFCFFSNDLEWVKNNLGGKNSIYMDKSMFSEYHDWYDMYLMSICKHNIIPNSTFGWWGAWLNQNPDKKIIAPKKWRTRWEATDWCPKEWILI